MRTWAAPGVRADPAEHERRHRHILARRNQDALTAWLSAEEACRMWHAGRLVPDRITAALDLNGTAAVRTGHRSDLVSERLGTLRTLQSGKAEAPPARGIVGASHAITVK